MRIAPEPESGSATGHVVLKGDPAPIDPSPSVQGLYYLRGEDPQSYTDVGSLSKQKPLNDEVTFCGAFIVFHYHGPAVYQDTVKIRNIYYHLWQKRPEYPFEGEIFDLGYNMNGEHTSVQLESITIDTKENVSEVDNYRLVQAMQNLDPEIATFENKEIFDFEVIATGNGPRIRCHANQYSFVILNLEEDAVLKTLDRDQDHINDFDELFAYYTNPFDADNTLSGNTAFTGGGVYCIGENYPLISDNIVTENTAVDQGGGFFMEKSRAVVTNKIVADNIARYGSGIAIWNSTYLVLANNRIRENTASQRGGGLHFVESDTRKFVNNTIYKNTAGAGGGISCTDSDFTSAYNTIWGNYSWGEFYLESPWMFVPLVPISSNGVLVIPTQIPGDPVGPYDIPLQGLVGDELTNLFVLEVK